MVDLNLLPSPTEILHFLEIAYTQNISRAAERLGMSQPTLSLAIQRLEDLFGSPLLIRTKTGVRLTQAGQRFATQSRLLVHEWERIRGDVLKSDSKISGRYVLGCHVSVALYSLTHFLPRLVRENPGLEIKLVHDLSRKIAEEVISFRADFGIVINPPEHPDLVIQPLSRDEVSFWVGPGSSPQQDPASGKAVLLCDPDLLQTQALTRSLARNRIQFARTVTSSSLEVIASLAAAGAGVAILPGRVALHDPSLKLRPLASAFPSARKSPLPVFQDRICLVFRADAQKTPASRELARTIESSLAAAWR